MANPDRFDGGRSAQLAKAGKELLGVAAQVIIRLDPQALGHAPAERCRVEGLCLEEVCCLVVESSGICVESPQYRSIV